MEEVKQNSKRVLSFFLDEIKKLEGQILNSPSEIVSSYISEAPNEKGE